MRNKRKIIIGVKVFIAIFSILWIIFQINEKITLLDLALLSNVAHSATDRLTLLTIFILLFINWSLESYKWQYLICKQENLSFFTAFRATLAGVASSIFTPNRIGEFAGKLFFLKHTHPIKAIVITLLGSTAQLLITVSFGTIALFFYLLYFNKIYSFYLIVTLSILLFILIILMLLFFLNVSFISNWVKHITHKKSVKQYFLVLRYYRAKEITKVLLISALRYIVFSVQYYLLLRLLNIDISFFEGMMMIALIFLVITAVPSFTLTEIGIRGSAAVYFLGMLSPLTGNILIASFLIWFINLIIPAVFGAIFLLTTNKN